MSDKRSPTKDGTIWIGTTTDRTYTGTELQTRYDYYKTLVDQYQHAKKTFQGPESNPEIRATEEGILKVLSELSNEIEMFGFEGSNPLFKVRKLVFEAEPPSCTTLLFHVGDTKVMVYQGDLKLRAKLTEMVREYHEKKRFEQLLDVAGKLNEEDY